MTKNIQLFHRRIFKPQNPLEVNPQLFREIKGKINGRNIFITSFLSMLTQLCVVVVYLGKLPDIDRIYPQFSRYCTGKETGYKSFKYLCLEQSDIWQINWHLFWHDIFIFFSIVSISILLILGTYTIIADLVKEEKKGTLNFIRLSPQSASSILLGKILGVPILVYFFIASIFPLHLISGLKANISGYLILLFYLVVLASCAFFYSLSLLLSFIKLGKVEFNPWITTFIFSLFIFITTVRFINKIQIDNSLIEWSYLFNPVIALTYTYLPGISSIPSNLGNYINIFDSLGELLFYGQQLWTKSITGIGFIFFNYCLWTYWFWQGATRLFYNPASTVFSKKQSYCITGCFVVIALGFTFQNNRYNNLFENFMSLQFSLSVMFLGLIAALSPQRQTLYDWARYRHQLSNQGKLLWQELVFGEKSPSTVAIAINALVATMIILLGSIFFLLPEEITTAISEVVLTMGLILFYAVIAQWMLLMKSNKRVLWTAITILLLIIIPPILFATAEATAQELPLVWLFSLVPAVAIDHASISALVIGVLGQWLAITIVSWQLINKLRRAGRSETKKIFDHKI